ncbi:MAG: cell division topological specificity factor MinE [Gammaproteobacteria bacterium]|nr:cell division topological specificity factor MinE [Gammaproteobacteria bacterium]
MSWFDYFRSSSTNTARTAKERLQIVIAHERANRSSPDYLPKLKKDILRVIAKYVPIKDDDVNVQVDREGDYEVLELNITLPEPEAIKRAS